MAAPDVRERSVRMTRSRVLQSRAVGTRAQARGLPMRALERLMRDEAACDEITAAVWLWCIVGCSAWWLFVAWAAERIL